MACSTGLKVSGKKEVLVRRLLDAGWHATIQPIPRCHDARVAKCIATEASRSDADTSVFFEPGEHVQCQQCQKWSKAPQEGRFNGLQCANPDCDGVVMANTCCRDVENSEDDSSEMESQTSSDESDEEDPTHHKLSLIESESESESESQSDSEKSEATEESDPEDSITVGRIRDMNRRAAQAQIARRQRYIDNNMPQAEYSKKNFYKPRDRTK